MKRTEGVDAQVALVLACGLVAVMLVGWLTVLAALVLALVLAGAGRLLGSPWWAPLIAGLAGAAALGLWGDGGLDAMRSARDHSLHALLRGHVIPQADWALVSAVWASPFAGAGGALLGHRWRVGSGRRRTGRVRVSQQRAGRLAARVAQGSRLPQDGVLLGIDERRRSVRLSDAELAAHALLVGATGAGKTTTLLVIVRSAIRRALPVVFVDLKGDPRVIAELQDEARAAGRPFEAWSLDGPACWNPLARGNHSELKDKLIGLEQWSEPHYKRAAERYLQTVFAVLHAREGDHTPPTLGDVVELMEPRRLNACLRHVPQTLADRVAGYLDTLAGDQLSAVRGLGTRLAVITESSAGQYLQPDEDGRGLDLLRCLQAGAVVVFSLNSSTYGELAAQVGGLILQDLKTVAGAIIDQGTTMRSYIPIDEFSALNGDHVLALLARGRAAGMAVLLCTQELADLARVAEGFDDQVIGTTAVKIAHRQDVPESAETIAGIAGTRQVWEHTRQTRHGLLGPTDTGLGSKRSTTNTSSTPTPSNTSQPAERC